MELVAHLRLSRQASIDLLFFCGIPVVLAMLSAVLGPYAAIMGGAGATIYVLSLAIVPGHVQRGTSQIRRLVGRTRDRSVDRLGYRVGSKALEFETGFRREAAEAPFGLVSVC